MPAQRREQIAGDWQRVPRRQFLVACQKALVGLRVSGNACAHLAVGLLDFVQQDDGVGVAPHGLRQLPALVVPNVAWRRADQPRNRVLLRIGNHTIVSPFVCRTVRVVQTHSSARGCAGVQCRLAARGRSPSVMVGTRNSKSHMQATALSQAPLELCKLTQLLLRHKTTEH